MTEQLILTVLNRSKSINRSQTKLFCTTHLSGGLSKRKGTLQVVVTTQKAKSSMIPFNDLHCWAEAFVYHRNGLHSVHGHNALQGLYTRLRDK